MIRTVQSPQGLSSCLPDYVLSGFKLLRGLARRPTVTDPALVPAPGLFSSTGLGSGSHGHGRTGAKRETRIGRARARGA